MYNPIYYYQSSFASEITVNMWGINLFYGQLMASLRHRILYETARGRDKPGVNWENNESDCKRDCTMDRFEGYFSCLKHDNIKTLQNIYGRLFDRETSVPTRTMRYRTLDYVTILKIFMESGWNCGSLSHPILVYTSIYYILYHILLIIIMLYGLLYTCDSL